MKTILATIIPYYKKYFRKMCNKYHNLVKKINKNMLFVIKNQIKWITIYTYYNI